MNGRQARVARGVVAAVVSALVAAVSHVAGGGMFPPGMLVLAAILVSAVFCIGVTGRKVSLARTILSVGVSQAIMHTVFAVSPAEISSTSHAAHGISAMSAGATHAMSPSPMMLATHVLAGILTVVLLRFGESAYLSLAEAAKKVIPAPPAFSIPGTFPAAPRPSSRPHPVLVLVEFLSCVQHRGPPAPAFS